MRLADLLLGNDLFYANLKLRDPIEIVHFDISSEQRGNQMSVTSSEQNVEQVELATSADRIVESDVTLVDSEMVTPSSDPIEIAAVTKSQSKQESDVDDGNTGSVVLSDEKNRMLRHGYD